MKKVLLSLIIATLLLGCQSSANVVEIMKKVEAVYNSAKTLEGVAEFYVIAGNNTIKSGSVKFIIKKPDRFIIEGRKFVTGSNGKVIWVLDKVNHTIRTAKYNGLRPDVDYGQFISRLIRYDLTLLGSEYINGAKCYVVLAKPNNTKMRIYIYIDENRFVPIKFVTKMGKIESIMIYKKIKLNVNVNDSVFRIPKNSSINI